MSDEIVGALIGVGGGIIGVALGFGFTWWRDKIEARRRHRQLMLALLVEVRHLDSVMGEIEADVNPTDGICWKRMVYDILGSSRSMLAEYGEKKFLSRLTTIHNDVILTNGLLDKLVKSSEHLQDKSGGPLSEVNKAKAQMCAVKVTTKNAIAVTHKRIRRVSAIVEIKYEVLCRCCCYTLSIRLWKWFESKIWNNLKKISIGVRGH